MNPFLSLGPLPTNVEDAVCQFTYYETGFCDTSSLDTGSENILISGQVLRLCNTADGVEVAKKRTNQYKTLSYEDPSEP